jgi:hypothetical protein
MAVANADQWKDGTPGALLTMWIPNDAAVSPQLLNFRHSWEGFIDSLLREWKTQNVIAALMLSCVLDQFCPSFSNRFQGHSNNAPNRRSGVGSDCKDNSNIVPYFCTHEPIIWQHVHY